MNERETYEAALEVSIKTLRKACREFGAMPVVLIAKSLDGRNSYVMPGIPGLSMAMVRGILTDEVVMMAEGEMEPIYPGQVRKPEGPEGDSK